MLFRSQLSSAPGAAESVRMLANRFADAARRGDKLHLGEEARFELSLRDNPVRALELAAENWALLQREPRDARIFLEAAVATKNPQAAAVALLWLRQTGYEEKILRELGSALWKLGP